MLCIKHLKKKVNKSVTAKNVAHLPVFEKYLLPNCHYSVYFEGNAEVEARDWGQDDKDYLPRCQTFRNYHSLVICICIHSQSWFLSLKIFIFCFNTSDDVKMLKCLRFGRNLWQKEIKTCQKLLTPEVSQPSPKDFTRYLYIFAFIFVYIYIYICIYLHLYLYIFAFISYISIFIYIRGQCSVFPSTVHAKDKYIN